MKPAAWRSVLGLAAIIVTVVGPASAEVAAAPPAQALLPPDAQDMLFFGPLRPILMRLHVTIDGKPFHQVWQERFDELFALEDRGGEGRVTVEQAEAIARDMNGSLRDSQQLDVKGIADAGGRVDRASLRAYVEKVFPPFVVRRRASIARDSALALFPLLDTNHDNRLSAAELAAAEHELKQRDFNDDGVVTAGELILDPKAIVVAADPTSADRALNPDESPVVALDPTTTAEQIADHLLAHYDRNHDGRLTTSAPEIEISLPAPLLGRLDANGDGALDRRELLGFADRRPDLELTFAMGRATASESRKQQPNSGAEESSLTRQRPGKAYTMPDSRLEFRVRKKLRDGYKLELGDSEIDFKRNNRDPRQADLVDLKSYDRDNNGYIDASEAANNNIGKSAFAAMDTDGDGKVYKGEFTSYMTRQNEAAAMRLLLEVTDKGQKLFEILDTDGDGVLSPREQRDAKNILAFADKDHDVTLGSDELPQSFDFELVRGADDLREEAVVGAHRATRSNDMAGTVGPLWFRKMDRNNDGDLSQGEFVGPLEAFRGLDANHDGFIDRKEAEAALRAGQATK